MLLEILYRVRAAPEEHLGCRSLSRLDAFHQGYFFFPTKVKDSPVHNEFRECIVKLYRPSFGIDEKDGTWILLNLARDEEHAFDLFFSALDWTLAVNPDVLVRTADRGVPKGQPFPASGFLNVLAQRPLTLLRRRTVACLRAFLDGYSLAAMEEGQVECSDLEGFEHWIRKKLSLKGMFRWENAVLAAHQGTEAEAFDWALRELKSYRSSKGPPSDLNYEIRVTSE